MFGKVEEREEGSGMRENGMENGGVSCLVRRKRKYFNHILVIPKEEGKLKYTV